LHIPKTIDSGTCVEWNLAVFDYPRTPESLVY